MFRRETHLMMLILDFKCDMTLLSRVKLVLVTLQLTLTSTPLGTFERCRKHKWKRYNGSQVLCFFSLR